jgi:hypothetical protein
MKNLFDIIKEAEEEPAGIDGYRNLLQAEKTKIPPAMASVKNHFLNSDEFELYEFLDNCEWWNCKIKKRIEGVWYRTGGVRVNSKGVIEFYYDEEYVVDQAKAPGKLAYFIAHEASHILRFHEDRRNAAGHKPNLANIAADMIINYDIDNTETIGGWKPIGDELDMKIPDKFHTDYKKDKKAYYYENMYSWLGANKKEREESTGEGESGQPQQMDYFKEGQIVKVNEGPHKDEYRKITSVNKDGTVETEECDIEAETAKAKSNG